VTQFEGSDDDGAERLEPGLAAAGPSLYAGWLERSSGTLSLVTAVYALPETERQLEARVAALSRRVRGRAVTVPSGLDSAFVAWEDYGALPEGSFVGIAEIGPEGLRWKETLGNGAPGERYLLPALAADGAGGVFAAFRHLHNGDKGVVVRHFSPGGEGWPDDVRAADAVSYKSGPALTVDEGGSVFVIWADGRGGGQGLYAQKISSAGAVLWDPAGVPLAAPGGNHWTPALAPDGAGGFYCAWIDDNNGARFELKLQRMDSGGRPLWGPVGVAAQPSGGRQSEPALASDGAGGVIVSWGETRYGFLDLFAQRFGPGGAPLWQEGGVRVSSGGGDKSGSRLAGDGAGGCLLAWKKGSGNKWKIFAQRLDAGGAPLW